MVQNSPSIHVLFKKRIQASISWRWISDVFSLKTDEMLSCESTVHKLCVTWDRSWCSAIGYLVRAGLFFALKWTCCAALCCSHRCETDPPSSPHPAWLCTRNTCSPLHSGTRCSLDYSGCKRGTTAFTFCCCWYVFKSVRAGSGHLVHVKVYKRNYRLLPLFSVGQISYVKDVQSAHAWFYRLLAWKYWDLAWKISSIFQNYRKKFVFSQNVHKNTRLCCNIYNLRSSKCLATISLRFGRM